MKCEGCNSSEFEKVTGERQLCCSSCELYNDAVAAQKSAAESIAKRRYANSTNAWLNEFGVFAKVDGMVRKIGSAEEAAPFVALTGAARRVTKFWRPGDP